MSIIKFNKYLELFGKNNKEKNKQVTVTKDSLIKDIKNYLSLMDVDPLPPHTEIRYDKRLGYITIEFYGDPYGSLSTNLQIWSDELIKIKASFDWQGRDIEGKSTSPEEYMTMIKTEQELLEYTKSNLAWILEEFIKDLDVYLKDADIKILRQRRKFRS